MTDMSRLGPIDWRWALPRILAVFLVTRLLVLAVAFTVEATQPPPPEDVIVDARPILTSLTSWDGRYYTSIADDGYHADPSYGPDYAFYPGYPIAVRALSLLTLGDIDLAAVLVANGAFLLLLVALFALSMRYLDRERAMLALWFFALAPGAVAYGLAYSESVFVLCLVLAFLAMERRHAWLAGIALALATLTRVPGILFGLPLLMLLVVAGRVPADAPLAAVPVGPGRAAGALRRALVGHRRPLGSGLGPGLLARGPGAGRDRRARRGRGRQRLRSGQSIWPWVSPRRG